MISETRQFEPKTPDQLTEQLETASLYSLAYLGEALIPGSLDNDDGIDELLEYGTVELDTTFSRRYQSYLEILRASKNGKVIPDEAFSESKHWLHVLNNLDNYIAMHKDPNRRTLYDEQLSVFESLRDCLEAGFTDGYVKLPTGSGKTVLFAEFVEATNLRTLVVVPTKLLVDQTTERFSEFAEDVETGKIYSHEKEYDKKVTVTTYKSFQEGVESGTINPDDYELLILDEAHKSLTDRRQAAANEFLHAIRLGFTATPKYTPDKHVGTLLDTEIHSMDLREAVEKGMLSPLSIYLAKTEVNLTDVAITRTGEYDDRDLDRAVNISSRNSSAVAMYKEMFAGQKALAYCVSVQHAMDLSAMFEEAGISVGVIYGTQDPGEQRRILSDYKAGNISVLCNADILIEGFDDPSASVCMNLRPTRSPVLAEQRAGRVLRLDPDNPQKHAYIVDFIDEVEDPNAFPVSLAQIVEGAHVFRDESERPEGYLTPGTGTPQYPFTQIEGIQVITHAEEIMRIVNEAVEKQYQPAHDGWLTLTGMSHRLRLSIQLCRKMTDQYREIHPEYFKLARNHRNRVYEHISPELISLIAEATSNRVAPVEGWVTIPQLAAQAGRTPATVAKALSEARNTHPNSVRVFKVANGGLFEHVSPELAASLISQLKLNEPPAGWITLGQAAEAMGVDSHVVYRLIDKMEDENSEHIVLAKGVKNRMAKFISPSLLDTIDTTYRALSEVPDGWYSVESLAQELGVPEHRIISRLTELRTAKPDSFGVFYTDKKNLANFFDPDVAQDIKDTLEILGPAPEGWSTIDEVASELGVSKPTVFGYLDSVKGIADEHAKKFNPRGGRGRSAFYLSPDLVDLIRQDRKSVKKAPSGWEYNFALTKIVNVSDTGLSSFVDQYRDSNPEYFMVARGGKTQQALEHYSPELISIIIENFGLRE